VHLAHYWFLAIIVLNLLTYLLSVCVCVCQTPLMMTPSSALHRPPSTPAMRHQTPMHGPPGTSAMLPPQRTPLAQFPSTPRQPWTAVPAASPAAVGVMNSPRPLPSSSAAAAAGGRGGSQKTSDAEWAMRAQQWASSRQQQSSRQTPTRPSPRHGSGTPGDATPLVDET